MIRGTFKIRKLQEAEYGLINVITKLMRRQVKWGKIGADVYGGKTV